uniref:hypothetical protein n=1 Tax=Streptomyces sp. CA-141956 TaxID=3240051 RepID=UPI003F493083
MTTPALATGLQWLHHIEQPDDAWMHHLGPGITTTHNRRLRFTATGADNLPVIVLEVAKPTWTENPHGDTCPGNPLTPLERDQLADQINALGYAVTTAWNGFPAHSGSVGLARPAHPTHVAAVNRYRRGCPTHPERSVFCECDAWRAGFRRAVPLVTPAAI